MKKELKMREIDNLLGIDEVAIVLILLKERSNSESGALIVKSPARTDVIALCDKST